VEQTHEPMDKNRRRRKRRASEQRVAKPLSIKDAKRKSGGCVRTAVELIAGGLCGVPDSGLGELRSSLNTAQKSAAGIVGPRTEGPNGKRGQ
jgi:hypothetical protein